jgi:FkbM family methyltransferase
MSEVKISYAQNREDTILEGLLSHVSKGFYVDVGSNDPNIDSVTKRFYMKGWSGINIEPNQNLFERLMQERTRDDNLCVAVGAADGTAQFREYPHGNGLSTLSETMKRSYDSKKNAYTIDPIDRVVQVRTLTSIFEERKTKIIDFLKVDVEGYEWEVIKGNDWKKYRPKLLCIESQHGESITKWQNFLKEHDYRLIFFDGLNEYYRDDLLKDWPDFSYAETVLALPIIPHKLYEERAESKANVGRRERELNLARIHIRHLWHLMEEKQNTINVLNEEIRQMQYLKRAVRIFLKSIDITITNRIQRLDSRAAVGIRSEASEPIAVQSKTGDELLSDVKRFDLESSYVRHIDNLRNMRMSYRIVAPAYGGFKKIVKASLKFARKMVRKIKK